MRSQTAAILPCSGRALPLAPHGAHVLLAAHGGAKLSVAVANLAQHGGLLRRRGEERGRKDQRGEQEFATHQSLVASTFRECFSEASLLSEKLLSKRIG